LSLYRAVVARPVAAWMITAAIMVFGLVSFAQLPVDLVPDISYPTLTVRTEFPGAAPEEVETQVSRPIEEALSTVEGLVGIESRSRAGSSDVVLEFDWDTSMAAASQDVRERLQATFMVEGVERPLLLRYDPSLDPILRVALAGGGDRSLLELRELAETDLKQKLETIDGVAAVVVRGGQERLVLVEPREDWLAARGVTLQQLAAVLRTENVNVAGGVVREGENEYLVRTLNEIGGIDDLRDLPIVRADGTRLRLSEVATITEAAEDRELVARLDGKEAVELEVYREGDANIVATADAVKAGLSGGALGEDLEPAVLDDQAAFIQAALDNLVSDAVLGGILAILVTFAFLRDWATTAIISTAIPISLVITWAVMYVGGTSLNLMSLGGLALGVSMVIDSGTVVLESVQVHVDAGKSRMEAAVAGTSEVATAVFASVLTGMAVFFPIVFVEGVAGQVFGDLATAVVFSLLASLGVALLFIPVLAAHRVGGWEPTERALSVPASSVRTAWREFRAPRRAWMQPYALLRFLVTGVVAAAAITAGVTLSWSARKAWRVVRWVAGLADRLSLAGADRFVLLYARVEQVFAAWLDRALRAPGRVLAGAGATLALGIVGFSTAGAELIPEVHQGRFYAELALPVGTPLSKTDAVMAAIESEVRTIPGIASVYSVVGTDRRASSRADEGEHSARILVQLDPGGAMATRETAAIAKIRSIAALYPGLDARFTRPALFTFHAPLEAVIVGHDLGDLAVANERALRALARVDGLHDVHSSLAPGYPEVRIRYDRDRLRLLGIGVGDVARAIRGKVQGERPTRIGAGERRVDLLARLDLADRDSVADLAALDVNPAVRPPVRLDSVATLELATGPSEIRRIDQRRSVVVQASIEGFDLAGAAAEARKALEATSFPEGVSWEVAGQDRELERSLASLRVALALAIFLVYVIMAATFESVRDPLVILFSVPLALVGVAAGLWLGGIPVSVVVFIGLIVLAGVVVANAIVLVDAINRLRAEGTELEAAIARAAAIRLRPILVTALNSVLGLLPLAIGSGAGQELQRPLAVTVIFGLASSTVLTLVVVPVVYRVAEGWWPRRVGRAE
jgi:HAE1 family hydrophobic/amphiphilic exporter-1